MFVQSPFLRRSSILAALVCALALSPMCVYAGNNDVNAGTPGADIPAASSSIADAGETIAIFGDLAPVNSSSNKYLSEAVKEANLLRPVAVFTVGGLIPGLDRSVSHYREEAHQLRDVSTGGLDSLKMPWYPCVGQTDVISGTREPADRTFETEYQKAFGPLYYSVDVGNGNKKNLHTIVLDSEEGVGTGNAISEEQLTWLKADLRKTFERAASNGGPKWVVVLVHRPLWRDEKANWDRVHQLLINFNERPIVSVEGGGVGGAGIGDGPRVVGVYSGDARAYSKEPTRDGIRYTVLGPTAARAMGNNESEAIRGFVLLKLDGADGGVHPAVVRLGAVEGESRGAIVADDVVTEPERKVLDAMAAIPEEVMGVEGTVDTEPTAAKLSMHVGNPLEVPLDIQIRLASANALRTPEAHENANAFVENFDAPWEMDIPHLIRHLLPGAKETWPMELKWLGGNEPMPAQVEFVLRWTDERGGSSKEVVLKRRVPVVPRAEVPVVGMVDVKGIFGWENAAQGGMNAWEPREDEPQERSPQWEMAADKTTLFVRVRVDDAMKSYWAKMTLDKKWGGLASDAVSVAWEEPAAPGKIRRVWALPFGPNGVELWTNTGIGDQESTLERLNPKMFPITATLDTHSDGYMLTLAIPRQSLISAPGKSVRMNISVHNNDNGAQTWVRSWAKENLGVAGWGRVSIREPAAATPTVP